MLIIPEIGRQGQVDLRGLWPASLAYLVSFRPVKGPVSERKVGIRELAWLVKEGKRKDSQ